MGLKKNFYWEYGEACLDGMCWEVSILFTGHGPFSSLHIFGKAVAGKTC